MKKIITTFILCILYVVSAWGQSSNAPSLPQLTTPSPKATMVDRFGYYPTNLYTGLVDITVPIHTIKVKNITVPIEFKYHASGLKYDDMPMEVGYGWTLIAGGMVNYSARGTGISQPGGTLLSPFVKKASDIVINDKTGRSDSDQLQLEYVENGNKSSYQMVNYFRDSEYDVYNFSFPGHSGQHYDMIGGDSFTNPSQIGFGGGYFPNARDEYGNQYYFELGESDDYVRTRTNYLTRIVSADGKETINFKYKSFGELEATDVKRPILNYTYIINEISNYGGTATSEIDYGGGMPGVYFKPFRMPVLTEISSSAGKVKFYYASQYSHSLVKIVITSPRDVILKTITLDKTNDAYLNAVNFCTPTDNPIYSYQFEYNGTKPEGNVSIDYWGYYNSLYPSSSNLLYVPDFTVPRYGYSGGQKIPGMNRTPDADIMQRGILKKITYPTHGYSEFTYEPHRSNGQIYGGLRIAQIKNYDENKNLLETKWYKYGWGEDGNGRATRRVESNDYYIPFLTVEKRYNPDGTPVDNVGKRISSRTYYPFPKCDYFAQGSTVVYPYVTEYAGSPSGAYGKTEYEYTDFADPIYDRSRRGFVMEIPQWSYTWKCGKLLRKTEKDSNGNVVHSLENDYEEINREDHINLKVSRYAQIMDGPSIMEDVEEYFSTPGYGNYAVAIGGSLHDYYNYYITSGEYAVKESRESQDGVTKTIRYKYNGIGQTIEETLIDSDNSNLTTCYKYPYDFWKEGSESIIQYDIFQKHMLALTLEKNIYKNGTLVDKITNEYKDWGGDLIALQYVKQLNYYEPRIKYENYDSYGNPSRILKDDLEQSTYLWGYKGQRIIAELKGGSFSVLGQALIDRVTKADYPSADDMKAIEALRDNVTLVNNRLTTFYYDSALNLSCIIMPNSTKTSYGYDDFGRLSYVKDHNGKIVEAYQYDYKQ